MDDASDPDENVDTANLEPQPAPAIAAACDKKKRSRAPRRWIERC